MVDAFLFPGEVEIKTSPGPQPIVYVIQCRDGSLYTGWTLLLSARLDAHRRGAGSRFVRSRLPFRLAAFWTVETRSAALREELAFKRLTRAQKLDAIRRGQVFGHKLSNAPDVCASAKKRRSAP